MKCNLSTLIYPWAQSLMRRMKFVKRRGSTQVKAKLSVADIAKLRKSYLLQIKGMVEAHNIPSQLVINWDQAGVKLVPSSNWTLEQEGAERVEIAGLNDKRQVTATLAGTLSGKLLPLQILYQGKTERCHPSQTFPDGFDIWHTPNHWANEETTLRFIENVILPYVQDMREKSSTPDQAALAIFDVFKGHMCDSVHTLLERNKILQVHIPNNCTDLLQPLDLSVNKPFKDKLRSKFSEWYTQEVSKQLEAGTQVEEVHVDMRMSVMKELSSRWFISAYDHIQSNPDIVKNGFKKAGITETLEKGLPEADAELDLQDLSENDPFSSDSD